MLAQGKDPSLLVVCPSLLVFFKPDPIGEQTGEREPSCLNEKGIQPLFPSRGSKAQRGKGNTKTPLEIPNH